ncbi:MAG: PHP domain-containing protein [bacterium]
MPADLHIHSNFSDGLLSPAEIVKKARDAGLTVISITDHDIVDGIDPAIAEGEITGVKIIPGIEFTTDVPGTEIHMLGYYIDHKAEWLLELLSKIQDDRTNRIHKIIDKLKKLGISISAEDVLKLAGTGSVGRPHVARALLQKGAVKSVQEAFNKYLGYGTPAYVPHFRLTPVQAVQTIIKAGGIPVYAHPAVSNKDEIIPELVAKGLAGIEAYYSKHSDDQTKHYVALAEKYGLLMTGGSDYHGFGTVRDVLLGEVKLPDADVKKLEEYHNNENKRPDIR